MRRSLLAVLVILTTHHSPLTAQAPRLASPALDEKLLREHSLPIQGPALCDFFRKRTPSADIIRRFDELLARCAADSYDDRTAATEELVARGEAVRPLLLRVMQSADVDREVLRRVATSLQALPPDRDAAPAMATARQIVVHKPAGALAALLDYVPFAPDELVRQEVQIGLNAFAAESAGKPDATLFAALKDAEPFKRAAAVEALARSGPGGRELTIGLLRDPSPRVRLQVALALAEAGDRDAVSALIDLLAVLPPSLAWSAQEVLLRLPDDDAPLPVLGGSTAPSRVASEWARWWKAQPAKLDVAGRLGPRAALDHLLLSFAGATGLNNSKVVELDAAKKPLWTIDGLRYPVDVQLVGKNRVLIAEYLGRRVTERDLKGNVLWEKAVPMPVACQRLPTGETFIACRQQLLVVDRQGKEVSSYYHGGTAILAAQRLRDGHTVIGCAGGTCHILDPDGREQKNFRIGQLYTLGANLEVLPTGRILVPLFNDNLVAEFDLDGNRLWQANVQRPTSAVRLASGNTLVVSQLQNRVVEIDPDGKEIWSHTAEGRPWRARWR
jgi:hypothetical protein